MIKINRAVSGEGAEPYIKYMCCSTVANMVYRNTPLEKSHNRKMSEAATTSEWTSEATNVGSGFMLERQTSEYSVLTLEKEREIMQVCRKKIL